MRSTDTSAGDVDLCTERLLLRRWRHTDREPFTAMGADPQVMRHFPALLSRAESDGLVDRIDAHFAEHGYGLWAVERIAEGDFIGFVGVAHLRYDAHFTPAIEIGWRLAARTWGRGYATEAARAVLRYCFDHLRIDELVSVTVPANEPSWRVMERIGMTRDPADDFHHPRVPLGHPLSLHVLYRIRRGGS